MSNGVFLYLVPGVEEKQLTREWLKEQPFANDFRDLLQTAAGFNQVGHRGVLSGPGGNSGEILFTTDRPSQQQFGYYPAAQEWRDFGGYWLGYDKAHPPGPQSLKRNRVFDGYEVELLDGQVWIAPTIRDWRKDTGQPGCMVPMGWGLNDQNESVLRPAKQYKEFWDIGAAVLDHYIERTTLTFEVLHDSALKCLGLNYRISRQAAEWLELFDSDMDQQVWRAAIDADHIDEWVKEKGMPDAERPT